MKWYVRFYRRQWRGMFSVLWIVARLIEAAAFAAAVWAMFVVGMAGGFLSIMVFVVVMHEQRWIR